MLDLYSRIDSEEVWTSRALIITIDEIIYFARAGLFESKEDVLLLMDKVLSVINKLARIVQSGDKGQMFRNNKEGGTLTLHYNDFNRFHTTIIGETEAGNKLFLTYDLPNFLTTTHLPFTDYSLDWIHKVKMKSSLLSGNTNLIQTEYFQKIKNYLSEKRSEVKKMKL